MELVSQTLYSIETLFNSEAAVDPTVENILEDTYEALKETQLEELQDENRHHEIPQEDEEQEEAEPEEEESQMHVFRNRRYNVYRE